MNIDMLSASGHKFNGPKGIGFLYIKKGLKLKSFIHGGQQERGRRAGTENVPGIVGIAKACEIAMAEMEERMKKETELRDYLIERILKEIPYTRLNGHWEEKQLPNNFNISFQFVGGGRTHSDHARYGGMCLCIQRLLPAHNALHGNPMLHCDICTGKAPRASLKSKAYRKGLAGLLCTPTTS